MEITVPNNKKKKVSIIGGGIAGSTTAYQLAKLGYQVNLIDPNIDKIFDKNKALNATDASLGITMGNIYRKSKGRSWELRKRSIELWKEWLSELNILDKNLRINSPLIQLTTLNDQKIIMSKLQKERASFDIKSLEVESLQFWSKIFNENIIGGLISYRDGRIDPLKLQNAIMKKLDILGVRKFDNIAISLSKKESVSSPKWSICLDNKTYISQDIIVICSSLNSQKLLKSIGYELILEPVLGQVIELDVSNIEIEYHKWPPILNFKGINFIRNQKSKLIMGATIENGTKSNINSKKQMHQMNGSAPQWLKNAKIISEWSGIRARPVGQPSPIIKVLEQGLLINTGQYRNGILLAPACAEWIGNQLSNQ